MTILDELYKGGNVGVPQALTGWDAQVSKWCSEYCTRWQSSELLEICPTPTAFIFDQTLERVHLAFAVSVPQLMKRDSSRMRGFPDVNISVQRTLGSKAFTVDRGHYLGHASGGELDINLFPHRRELNRGWSQEGKRFRMMEAHVANNIGTFFFHRAMYDDTTWIPATLEFGVLREDGSWWRETFHNKPTAIGEPAS